MSSIFVSYCRSDRAAIDKIVSEVSTSSLRFWVDDGEILPTMEFNDKILEGLATCSWFLIVMTPRSAESEYVKDELHWALTNRSGRIIPVMLDHCDPATFHLRMLRIQYVDLTPDNQDGLGQLQQALQLVEKANKEDSLPLNSQKMDVDLELVSLLLTFISRNHQKHLRNMLAEPDSDRQSYIGCHTVRHELRHLCSWGLLNRCPDVMIGQQAGNGQRFILRDVVELTEIGAKLARHVS